MAAAGLSGGVKGVSSTARPHPGGYLRLEQERHGECPAEVSLRGRGETPAAPGPSRAPYLVQLRRFKPPLLLDAATLLTQLRFLRLRSLSSHKPAS